jgi:hypothetical protein
MYKKKTNKGAINNLFIFTFLQELLEIASTFTDTAQLCAQKKLASVQWSDAA